jgi:galactokinase
MEVDKLKEIASLGQFFSYVAGTTAAVLESEAFTSSSCGAPSSSHRGIEIDNYRTTLPTKKGLSSSAAVCVLIARCFAAVFDLSLSLEQLMEIAYRGEMYTPSRCGRMDQCVVTYPISLWE